MSDGRKARDRRQTLRCGMMGLAIAKKECNKHSRGLCAVISLSGQHSGVHLVSCLLVMYCTSTIMERVAATDLPMWLPASTPECWYVLMANGDA